MLWVYDHYEYFDTFSAGTVFRRLNLTSIDVRFRRLKTVLALKGLSHHNASKLYFIILIFYFIMLLLYLIFIQLKGRGFKRRKEGKWTVSSWLPEVLKQLSCLEYAYMVVGPLAYITIWSQYASKCYY